MAGVPQKLKQTKSVDRPDIVLAMARIPNTARLLLGGSEFHVSDVDLSAAKPEIKDLGKHESYVTGVAVAGSLAVSGSYDGRLLWWNWQERKQVRAVEAHRKWIRAVEATRDGKIVASVADDMVCRLWDAATGNLLRELHGHAEQTPHHFPSMLYACAFTPDGNHVATADKVGHVVIWEIATRQQVIAFEVPEMYTWDPTARRHSIGGIRSLAFSPDGVSLAVGGIGKIGNVDHLEGKARVEVFDWRKGQRTHEFISDKFNGLIERLAFHPQNEWLVAGGGANDGFLMFFDLKGKKTLLQEKAPMHVHSLALNEAGNMLYVAGNRKVLAFEING